jgi:hypothetical protein
LYTTWPSRNFKIDGFDMAVGQLAGCTFLHALGTVFLLWHLRVKM